MSLEVWSTVASVGTFIVIAATAIAALIQLRHMRGSNQIAVYTHIEQMYDTPEVVASRRFITQELAARMLEPEFRRALRQQPVGDAARPILPLMNAYEDIGNLVKHGFIERDFVLDSYGGQIIGAWRALQAVIPIVRATQGDAVALNFEYLAALAQQAIECKTYDVYPRGVARMPVDMTWLDADRAQQ